MNIKPVGNRVLVAKPIQKDKVSTGGILLSDAPEPDNEAKVLAVGDEVTNIVIGDIVIYPAYGLTEIEDDDVSYLIIDAADILAVRMS